jgi:hypothetical protein
VFYHLEALRNNLRMGMNSNPEQNKNNGDQYGKPD